MSDEKRVSQVTSSADYWGELLLDQGAGACFLVKTDETST